MTAVRSVTPPPGYGPTMMLSVSQEEVKCWLTRLLPGLGEEDAVYYQAGLIADGFDCRQRLMLVLEDDLDFMTREHKRTLMRNLITLRTTTNPINNLVDELFNV